MREASLPSLTPVRGDIVKVYCVEDDTDIREIELYVLRSMNFEAEGFADAESFFAGLRDGLPDLVLLDVMLPDVSGVDILKRLRSQARTRRLPVIMATARGAEYEKVAALDAGADDYLTKPFSMMEMVARVKAVLRRTNDEGDVLQLTVDELSVNEAARTVTVDGQAVELTLKEFELLILLMKSPTRVFTRDQLHDRIWGTEYDGENRTVDVHVRRLRQKLGTAERFIKTVRGLGYRFDESGESSVTEGTPESTGAEEGTP